MSGRLSNFPASSTWVGSLLYQSDLPLSFPDTVRKTKGSSSIVGQTTSWPRRGDVVEASRRELCYESLIGDMGDRLGDKAVATKSAVVPAKRAGNPIEDALITRLRGVAAVIVALVAILGFAAFVAYLVVQVSSASEGSWTRLVYLFGAVEALVFTAFGWLFGREVHRQAAETAEARADDATDRAETANAGAADQKARGEALRAGIEARAGVTNVEKRGGLGDVPAGPAVSGMDDLVALARALFP
jgi:hypothetical protein